jgi:hypothetical protein
MNWPVIDGTSNVFRQSYVNSFLDVSGLAYLRNDASVNNRLFVKQIMNDLSLSGRMFTNNLIINNVSVNGLINQISSSINQTINTFSDYSPVNSTSYVGRNLYVNKDVTVNIVNNGNLFIGSDASLSGNLYVGDKLGLGKFPTYNLDINGTLSLSSTSSTNNYNNSNSYVTTDTSLSTIVSPNTTNATFYNWVNNNINWTASASNSQSTYYAYKAFNNNYTTSANSYAAPSIYNTNSGNYLSYVYNSSSSVNTHGLTATGLYARYTASNYGISVANQWNDSTSNARHILSSQITSNGISTPTVSYTSGGAMNSFKVVQGNTNSRIQITSGTLSPYTLFHVARYTGGNRGRIFTGVGYNWLSGFHGGRSGVTYHFDGTPGWITREADMFLNNWVISTDAYQIYRGNGINLTTNSNTGNSFMPPITVNSSEQSDFQIADVLIYNYQLSNDEILGVENYLSELYGIPLQNTLAYKTLNLFATTLGQSPKRAVTSPIIGQLPQYGEWLQIQSSIPLKLSSYQFASGGLVTQLPKNYWIVGSNDLINWYPIQYATFAATPSSTAWSLISSTINANFTGAQTIGTTTLTTTAYSPHTTNTYTYFRLIGNSIFPSNTYGNFEIGAWIPQFTTPSNTLGPSSAIMYVDPSNINQIDISGSLALVNSNATSMIIRPNSTISTPLNNVSNPNANIWTSNNVQWSVTSSSQYVFTPTKITGCLLWLDAAEYGSSTTIVSGTANVSQWNDKSGNGYHFTNGATLPRINWGGGQHIEFTSNATMTNSTIPIPTNYTIFVVGYTGSNGYGRLLNGSLGNDKLFFGSGNGVTQFAAFVGNNVTFNDTNTNTPAISVTTPCIMAVTNNNTTTGLIPYVNGTAQTAKNGSTVAFTGLVLGGAIASQYWNGYICEVIIYNRVLSTSQREQVEGYLASKWCIQPSFPSSHPYYLSPGNGMYNYNAFGNGNGLCWANSTTANYSTTTGKTTASNTYTTTVSGSSVVGEWLQLQSSIPLTLSNYYFMSRAASATNTNFQCLLPSSWKIVGSNDGTIWYPIQDASCTALPGISGTALARQTTSTYTITTDASSTQNSNADITGYATSTNSYNYFRLIVQSILEGTFSTTDTDSLYRGQLQLFFFPTFTKSTSAVSLAIDNNIPNKLNVGGSVSIEGSLTVYGKVNCINPYWVITGGQGINNGSSFRLVPGNIVPFNYIVRSNFPQYYNTSNFTFTAPVTGKYLFVFSIYSFNSAASSRLAIFKNNFAYSYVGGDSSESSAVEKKYPDIIYLTAGDYINFRALATNTVTMQIYFPAINNVPGSDVYHTYCTINYIN